MVYVLDSDRREQVLGRAVDAARAARGVDLVLWLTPGDEAVVQSPRGELRFAPEGELDDTRGRNWSVEGQPAALGAELGDGRFTSHDYPDALARIWSALHCPRAGDVLVSAAPGFEFVDWGGADHVGGGSHGSLHSSDSVGALLWCGTGPSSADAHEQWSLEDIVPMVKDHFGL
jgi:hypothetical protein